jgi:hypothetical protein
VKKIIQYLRTFLYSKSKRRETKLMHPSSSRAFQRDQECDLKRPGSVDLMSTNKTKQNKRPSFIDRFQNQRTMDFDFYGKKKEKKSELKDGHSWIFQKPQTTSGHKCFI